MILRRGQHKQVPGADQSHGAGSNRKHFGARVCAALALAVAILAALIGVGRGIDQDLQLWRDTLLRHPASGKLGLVEIDARSLKAFNTWPWPRGLHARALTALERGGAEAVVFDADFSAQSTPSQDREFAQAIAAARIPVYLPTFRQSGSQGGQDMVENLPVPVLREHAQLGSVNIAPDGDGFVRAIPYGVVTSGVARPSMAAVLAGASGNVNHSFAVDGSIDENSIPRVSFVDLVNGRVLDSVLRGRSFMVGATAVEMGDRYAMPGHGVVPGALLQLLGSETLIGHSVPVDHGALPGVLVLLALVLLRGWQPRLRHPLVTGLSAVALVVLPLAMQMAGLGVVRLMPALLGLATLALGDVAAAMVAALRKSRTTDALTGLPNAKSLRDGIAGVRQGHVVVLRLVNFADVVNVLGQAHGSDLILRTARRLSALTSQTIHHVEPNALAWLDPGTDQSVQVEQIEAGVALFNQPVDLDGRPVRIVPAFGVAACDDAGSRTLDRALLAADRAVAKGSRWDWYHAATDQESDWRLSLAAEVDAALASGAIHVVYQPQFDMNAQAINAAEALVRWNHPNRGPINPEHLIALVEEHNLIAPLTLHVLRTALNDQRRWTRAGIAVHVAVNISALLPTNAGFINDVAAMLADYPGAAERLTLEITESTPMIHMDSVIAALERLGDLGITISIDDYGTGQSTLTYLRNLPAREIKIDKSFIINMESSRSDQLMVASTIALAHALEYKVVAEGVETAAILDLLAQAGCDFAQGWHIGRPMPAADLQALVSRGHREAA